MKKIIFLVVFLLISSVCFAETFGRVCLMKDTGELIEFQSGDAPLGVLIQNAINSGYQENDIEEKRVTKEEYVEIFEEWVLQPLLEKAQAEAEERKLLEEEMKEKLDLNDEDWEKLKELMKQ